jgi:hypothetical protein
MRSRGFQIANTFRAGHHYKNTVRTLKQTIEVLLTLELWPSATTLLRRIPCDDV